MLKYLKYLSLLVLVAFLLRLINVLFLDYVINPDATAYITLARKLAAGDFFGFLDLYWSPLYPFTVSIFTLFSDSKEFSGIGASLFFSCLLPIAVFFLVKQQYGVKEGYLSAAITVVYPYLIKASVSIVPEPLYILLISVAVFVDWQTLMLNVQCDSFPILISFNCGVPSGVKDNNQTRRVEK